MTLKMWRIDFEAEEGGLYYSFLLAENPETAREEAQTYLFEGDSITQISGPVAYSRAFMRSSPSGALAEGYSFGVEWAELDRRDGLGTQSDEIERLREEAQSEQRWARAFYLGALRGYRSVVREFKFGRWGT